MRAALNIAFGLLLLVMQAVALVAPHSVEKPEICKCCSCGSDACATPTRTASPPASPLVVQTSDSRAEARKPALRPVPPQVVPAATRLVDNQAARSISPSPFASPPLYERFCLLLI